MMERMRTTISVTLGRWARPAYRRQGLTQAVLIEGLRRMQAGGMERVCVSTGETNTPTRRLYESVGFRGVNR